MIEIASIISQNCSPRAYNIVKRGESSICTYISKDIWLLSSESFTIAVFDILNFFNHSQSYCLLSEGLTLPPNQIISSHTVKSGDVLLECYEFCKKEPTCIGFNYRNTKNVVNCQLTNITGERYHNTMKGEWILLEDVKAVCICK